MPDPVYIALYVAYDPYDASSPWGCLKYYQEYEKINLKLEGGNLGVETWAEGSLIEWRRAEGEEWTFHELVLHPRNPASGGRGLPTDFSHLLDLTWQVSDETIRLFDKRPRQAARRTFNYTLSILQTVEGDSTKIYFDPEFVDIGGE